MTDPAREWDQAAPDYQRVYRLGLNENNARLLRFWEESGMLFPGARVLDIGCGVGKYGTWLAELGYDVTLTDISAVLPQPGWGDTILNSDASPSPVFSGQFDRFHKNTGNNLEKQEAMKEKSLIFRRICQINPTGGIGQNQVFQNFYPPRGLPRRKRFCYALSRSDA